MHQIIEPHFKSLNLNLVGRIIRNNRKHKNNEKPNKKEKEINFRFHVLPVNKNFCSFINTRPLQFYNLASHIYSTASYRHDDIGVTAFEYC